MSSSIEDWRLDKQNGTFGLIWHFICSFNKNNCLLNIFSLRCTHSLYLLFCSFILMSIDDRNGGRFNYLTERKKCHQSVKTEFTLKIANWTNMLSFNAIYKFHAEIDLCKHHIKCKSTYFAWPYRLLAAYFA